MMNLEQFGPSYRRQDAGKLAPDVFNSRSFSLQSQQLAECAIQLERLLLPTLGQRASEISVALTNKFQGINGILSASVQSLTEVLTEYPDALQVLRSMREVYHLALGENTVRVRGFDEEAIGVALVQKLSIERIETVFGIFYDHRWNVLWSAELFRGTFDSCPVYPKEIARRCLEVGASRVIISHNHPATDELPSKDDVRVTRDIERCLQVVDARLYDHIIVGSGRFYSMRSHRLI